MRLSVVMGPVMLIEATARQDPTNGGGNASPPLQAGGPHGERPGFSHARHGGPGRLLVGQPGEVRAGLARHRARHPREGEGTLNTPEIRGLGIVQDGFTGRWKATGEVEGVGWLEAWGSTLVEAMEALQAKAATIAQETGRREENS
jgi:hypothetical protein